MGAELKRMRLMLEEMQVKMQELMTRCRRRFGGDVSEIVDELGLKDLLKEETVFQRLYDDAMDRVARLEKLREKVRKERKDLCPSSASLGGTSPEPSVLEEVQKSQLGAMRRLVGDPSAPPPTTSASPRRK